MISCSWGLHNSALLSSVCVYPSNDLGKDGVMVVVPVLKILTGLTNLNLAGNELDKDGALRKMHNSSDLCKDVFIVRWWRPPPGGGAGRT